MAKLILLLGSGELCGSQRRHEAIIAVDCIYRSFRLRQLDFDSLPEGSAAVQPFVKRRTAAQPKWY
jgi:hypothetical protein